MMAARWLTGEYDIGHWAEGVSHSEEPTHIMILTAFVCAERPELVKDGKKLLESDQVRKCIGLIVKFFQKRGITGLKAEDLEYTYSVGRNPILITVCGVLCASGWNGGTDSVTLRLRLVHRSLRGSEERWKGAQEATSNPSHSFYPRRDTPSLYTPRHA
jgi:hypothetical protein